MRNMRSVVIVRHSAASIVVVASDGQSVGMVLKRAKRGL